MLQNIIYEISYDKEYLSYVNDIFDNKAFQSMDNYIQHGSTTTKIHCINVSYIGYKICKKYNLNYISAARGGLLHDYYLYDWHSHYKETGKRFHGFTHPKTALINASAAFNLSTLEQNIILRHMWPLTIIPPKNIEGFIITFVDKYCGFAEFYDNLVLKKESQK